MDIKKNKVQKTKLPKQTGRWTKEQHQLFLQGVVQYGKNWKKVQEIVKTRTGAQIRSHAQKFFGRLDKQKKKNQEQIHSYTEQKQNEESNENPPEMIISLIRKQSKEDKSINVTNFVETLNNSSKALHQDILKTQKQQKQEQQPNLQLLNLKRQRSKIQSVVNFLDAYDNINQQKTKDQSFFLTIVKRYKKYFEENQFTDLIDFPNEIGVQIQKIQKNERKRSFSLLQNTEQNVEQLNEFRKKIKLEQKPKTVEQSYDSAQKILK